MGAPVTNIRSVRYSNTSLLLLSSHAFHDGDQSPTGYEQTLCFIKISPTSRTNRVTSFTSFFSVVGVARAKARAYVLPPQIPPATGIINLFIN